MSGFYNFDWGKENLANARHILTDLKDPDGQVSTGIAGVVLASVIVSRGRNVSPSARFEELINLGTPTGLDIMDAVLEAWNILSAQSETTLDAIQAFTELLDPRNINLKRRNGPAVSPKLHAAVNLAYESVLDLWVVVADFAIGLKSTIFKVLKIDDSVRHNDYLHRGMTRSQLEASFGGEFETDSDSK